MSGIVFKQRFNPVSSEKTPGLNVRHLQYIATRPGAVYNRGCGFGLWGRLPGQRQPEDIQSLDQAKALLQQVSQRRTVYKAVISVGKKDAAQNGLYDRSAWEQLTRQHMAVIAKQMSIADKDFCYFISMHQAGGHPHIHILYWDNGTEPRQEFLPKERFEQIAEAVRADWNRDIMAQEITASRTSQQETASELRTALQAMCLEANPVKGLNLSRLVVSPEMPELSDALWKLVTEMPSHGSLKYRYLPPQYKQQLNAFLDRVLAMPEMKGVYGRYISATDALSAGYGNGEETAARNREKAVQKLYTALGNQVMDAIREIAQELEQSPPDTLPELLALAKAAVTPQALQAQPGYLAALSAMPRERIPTARLYELPVFCRELDRLTDELIRHDPVLRGKLNGYIRRAIQTSDDPGETAGDIRRAFYHALRGQVVQLLRADAGYNAEMQRTCTARVLQTVFRLLCQFDSQQQAQSRHFDLHRKTLPQKSKEARKDTRARMRQRGSWSQNLTDIEQ